MTKLRKYILLLLLAISGLAVGNEQVRNIVAILAEIIQNLPDDLAEKIAAE